MKRFVREIVLLTRQNSLVWIAPNEFSPYLHAIHPNSSLPISFRRTTSLSEDGSRCYTLRVGDNVETSRAGDTLEQLGKYLFGDDIL